MQIHRRLSSATHSLRKGWGYLYVRPVGAYKDAVQSAAKKTLTISCACKFILLFQFGFQSEELSSWLSRTVQTSYAVAISTTYLESKSMDAKEAGIAIESTTDRAVSTDATITTASASLQETILVDEGQGSIHRIQDLHIHVDLNSHQEHFVSCIWKMTTNGT